jgi:hypothetical protein
MVSGCGRDVAKPILTRKFLCVKTVICLTPQPLSVMLPTIESPPLSSHRQKRKFRERYPSTRRKKKGWLYRCRPQPRSRNSSPKARSARGALLPPHDDCLQAKPKIMETLQASCWKRQGAHGRGYGARQARTSSARHRMSFKKRTSSCHHKLC